MKSNLALAFYYSKLNRYSFNALAGAIESNNNLKHIKPHFFSAVQQLINGLDQLVQTYEKVLLGISFCTTQLPAVSQLVAQLRNRFQNKLLLVAGGPHPTGEPFQTLGIGFDLVVKSEGEETLSELLTKIQANETYLDLKGICYCDETGRYTDTGDRPWIDLNKFRPFSIKYAKFGPIEITRGCTYGCYFCQTPRLFGRGLRHRSIEVICEAVTALKARGLTDIRFITPNAFSYGSHDGKTINIDAIEQLLYNVKKIIGTEGRIFFGTFPSEVRPEHVTKDTLALIKKYANNQNIIIGAQTGSQRLLNLCRRGHTVEDIYRAVELTTKAGLVPNVDFIFGLPDETEEDIKLTTKLVNDLVELGAKIHAHSFIPLPQTPFAYAPPRQIHHQVKRLIADLTAKGVAYGSWLKQEQVSKWIAAFTTTDNLRR